MKTSISARIKILQGMTVAQLREEYQELYGEKTSAGNKTFLLKKVAWRIQELEFGGVPVELKQKAMELVEKLDVPGKIPSSKLTELKTNKKPNTIKPKHRDKRLPMAGAVITKTFKGKQISVGVLEDGFEFLGVKYRSLSAVAEAATGCHLNGYSFFNLK